MAEGFLDAEVFGPGETPALTAEEKAERRLRIRRAMEVPEVREWLKEILEFCGLFHHGFSTSSVRDFNAGMRNVALKLVNDVGEACQDKEFMGELMLSIVAPREVEKNND